MTNVTFEEDLLEVRPEWMPHKLDYRLLDLKLLTTVDDCADALDWLDDCHEKLEQAKANNPDRWYIYRDLLEGFHRVERNLTHREKRIRHKLMMKVHKERKKLFYHPIRSEETEERRAEKKEELRALHVKEEAERAALGHARKLELAAFHACKQRELNTYIKEHFPETFFAALAAFESKDA